MKKIKVFLTTVMVILMFSLTVGCGSQSKPSSTENTDNKGSTTGNSAERKKIGMVVKNTNSEYIQAFIIGATQTCEELGIDLVVTDAQADSLKIMDAIDTFIVQDIDGFILAGAEDLVTLVPGIEKLNEAKIPVFALDTCPEGGYVDMFLTFDLQASSEKAARQMVEGIKKANNGQVPEGVVIEITGSLVDMFTTECHNGFIKVMEEYPQLTVVQGEGKWNNDDSYNRTSDLLTRYGDEVVAVYVQTPDIMGSGAVAAIENAGKNPADYFISGICIGLEGIDLLNKGKLYAVVEQPALDSSILAVRYLNDIFNGKEIPKVGDTVKEEGALWSPATVIENTFADGGTTMILLGPLVPQEVSSDNEKLWENRIKK
ncbi:MAG: sugar ABC transporter substrate-binding protein [Sedimentibacter sp.]|uniref:sugar ABC transporter substrate-binding protein n=1 Tax=Sedimentibacter sp. TaxID=1960295 RepID=UPI003158D121